MEEITIILALILALIRIAPNVSTTHLVHTALQIVGLPVRTVTLLSIVLTIVPDIPFSITVIVNIV